MSTSTASVPESRVIQLAEKQMNWLHERNGDGLRIRLEPEPGSDPRMYRIKMECLDPDDM